VPVDRQDLSARHGIDAQVAPWARRLELLTEATHRTAVGAVEPTLTHLLGQSGSRAGPVHKRRAPRPVARPRRRPAAGSMLCGCFEAMSRDASAAGGLDRRFARHGRKDIDPCVRLWRLGLKCLVKPRAVVAHRFPPREHRRRSGRGCRPQPPCGSHRCTSRRRSSARSGGRAGVLGPSARPRRAWPRARSPSTGQRSTPVPPRIRITPPELTTQRLEGRLERSGDHHRHRSGRLSPQATRSPSPTR
jgi:hypothetical protein